MILLTTGTQLPFDRLVRAVDEWVGAARPSCEVVAQVLPSSENPYVPRNFETTTHLTPTKYADVFAQASLVVSHAGMGTILTALTQGKRICIMPRQYQYGEHRNDHQMATAQRLKAHPGLYKAGDETDLPACLDAAIAAGGPEGDAIAPFASEELTDRLREFILAAKT